MSCCCSCTARWSPRATDDCEGDTLARVRQIVGPEVTIGIELDLHCHLTEQMREKADIIITFKEYPHIDMADRARELYLLCLRARRGEIHPVMAYYDCRMINMWRTPLEPMRGFVRRMAEHEGRDGILSVSFGHGFPWGDVADVGAKMLVVADGDAQAAAALATTLGRELWEMREQTAIAHDTIDGGIDAALDAQAGPVVLADVADNAGGGAPADSTPILRRLVERGIKDVAIGIFWDPLAVRFCQECGEGARISLRIGGKCGAASGDPIDLPVVVRRVAEAHTRDRPERRPRAARPERLGGVRRDRHRAGEQPPPDVPPRRLHRHRLPAGRQAHRGGEIDAAFLCRLRADREAGALCRGARRDRAGLRGDPVHEAANALLAARGRSVREVKEGQGSALDPLKAQP